MNNRIHRRAAWLLLLPVLALLATFAFVTPTLAASHSQHSARITSVIHTSQKPHYSRFLLSLVLQ